MPQKSFFLLFFALWALPFSLPFFLPSGGAEAARPTGLRHKPGKPALAYRALNRQAGAIPYLAFSATPRPPNKSGIFGRGALQPSLLLAYDLSQGGGMSRMADTSTRPAASSAFHRSLGHLKCSQYERNENQGIVKTNIANVERKIEVLNTAKNNSMYGGDNNQEAITEMIQECNEIRRKYNAQLGKIQREETEQRVKAENERSESVRTARAESPIIVAAVAGNGEEAGGTTSGGSGTATVEAKCGTETYDETLSSERRIKNKIEDLKSQQAVFNQKAADIRSNAKVRRGFRDGEEEQIKGFQINAQECGNLIRKYENDLDSIQTCNESREKLQEAKQEFRQACAGFARGIRCAGAIKACELCPDGEDVKGYKCVTVHERSSCPALAGRALEEAKEQRDEFLEEVEQLQEELSEAERDIAERQGELEQQRQEMDSALAEMDEEFTAASRELRDNKEQLLDQLNQDLKQGKAQIQQSVQEQIAQANAEIDNALQVSHSIENAITEAETEYSNSLFPIHQDYRQEHRKIRMECEVQARGALASYRQRRRQAVESGNYQESLSSLLSRGRTGFAQRDSQKLERNYNRCLVKRRPDFAEIRRVRDERLNTVKTRRDQQLRVIEQQKEQYQQVLQRAQRSLEQLNEEADRADQTLLAEYTENLNQILDRHDRAYDEAFESYQARRGRLIAQLETAVQAESRQITILEKQMGEKNMLFQNKQLDLVRFQEMTQYLQEGGVEEDGNQEDAYGEAVSAFSGYDDANTVAEDKCGCGSDDEAAGENKDKLCKIIKANEKEINKGKTSKRKRKSSGNGYSGASQGNN